MNVRHLLAHRFFTLAFIAFLLFDLPACTPLVPSQTREHQELLVGMDDSAAGALIHLAISQGFFSDNGLSVAIKTYPTGLASAEGVINEEIDVGVAAEFALVGKIFVGEPIHSWGSIDRFMHVFLVGRTASGIQAVSDLKGKKIGLPLKTAAEFYLGRYLDLNGLSLQEITAVNLSPGDMPKALKNGEVDAVVVWPPNSLLIEDQLGSGSVFCWPLQNDQVGYVNLVSTEAWIQAHPEQIKHFLQSLVQAEVFYASHPQEAQAILQKRLSLDRAFTDSLLGEHQFQVSLDQSMILAMEDEARWMIDNQVVTNRQTPNFTDNLYLDGLLAVRPDSVNIIR